MHVTTVKYLQALLLATVKHSDLKLTSELLELQTAGLNNRLQYAMERF